MRGERPSLTAQLVAAVRAMYAEMPDGYRIAPDEHAADLAPRLLALPARLLGHAPAAGPLVHRALGGALLGITYHVALRTAAIDDALRAALDGGARQVVVLGAGLDNRATRMPELRAPGVRVFEVDHPSTQAYKGEKLRGAGLTSPAVPVPVDFERTRLADALPAARFSPGERSFWIWEGVTVYLTPEAIAATLDAVASLSTPGSRIAITYAEPDFATGAARVVVPAAALLAGVVGEPVRCFLAREQMADALRRAGGSDRAGFRVLSDESDADWGPRYWPHPPPGLRAWERLVVAER